MTTLDLSRASLDAIAARAGEAAAILRLPFQNQAWRGQVGDFAGSGVGSSLDFQDHRSYAPGDDPRHINWQAYARTGNYSMKLYREEVRPLVDLVLDVSDSMFFTEAKTARSLELFYFAVHAVRRSGASLIVHLLKGPSHLRLEDTAIPTHAWIPEAEALPATASSAPPHLGALPLRSQSMRILISDLLFPESPDTTLRHLSERRGRGIVFSPFSPEEAAPGWEGNFNFVDAESATRHHHRVDTPLLHRYLANYHRHFELWKERSRKYDVLFARVSDEPPLLDALRTDAARAGIIGLA